MSQEQAVVIPSSPEDRKQIADAIKEISNATVRIESERDYINESYKLLKDDFDLPLSYLKKIGKAYHKQNLQSLLDEAETIDEGYQMFFPSNRG